MIDVKKLKQLIELMKENEITELDIRDQEGQVTLKRGSAGTFVPTVVAAPAPVAPAPAAATAAAAPAAPAAAPAADEGLVPIASPMVGTFYAAASPDAEAFAKVGQSIGKETVVCIIEAMKVFNEIKAEVSGTIAKVLVSNGQAVEFGQPLFMVKPN
jgi:acetyl-CoA carboxylase biotin carboxyl carrier protein